MKSVRIPAGTTLKDILSDISAFRNSCKPIAEFSPVTLKPAEFSIVYQTYEDKKRQSDFMDFDDMLCLCKELLTDNTRVLKECRNKYRYIMCDEYQDTNQIQKEILYLLAGKNGNICVVGDVDQSIYGFRGALPVIMMDFKKDFPNLCEISMDINYRSKPEIIAAAGNLIKNNTERFEKDFVAARDGHGEVVFKTLTDRKTELDYLSDTIARITASGADPARIAVLVRTNMQLDDVAAELERRRIGYTSSDAIKDVYEHFIYADVISYLRIINGGWQASDLLQVLNKPVRYLRKMDFRGIKVLDLDTLIENIRKNDKCRNTNVDAVTKLYNDIQNLRNVPLIEQVKGIVDQIGYRSYLFNYAKATDQNDDFLMAKLDYFIADAKQYASTDECTDSSYRHIQCHKKQMRGQIRESSRSLYHAPCQGPGMGYCVYYRLLSWFYPNIESKVES
ncbi:ATP-dependent helicase [Enterocloster clostridioformis]